MSVVVRYVCHQCGAAAETGHAGWVRCQHCDALIAFDWQAWFGSKEYAAYLRVASHPDTLAGWQRYQAASARAEAASAAGDRPAAEASMRQAVEQLVALTPSIYPPELQANAAYRERYVRWMTWTLLAQKTDRELAALQSELMAKMQAIDWRDPLPALEHAASLLTRQVERMALLNPPEDPDGMPPPARLKATMTQFLGGYLQMLSPEQVRAVLERIHGKANVHEAGAGVETLGLYREWRCPACGLVSLQANMVQELTCMGCVFRKPIGDASKLPRLELGCGRCGAAMVLEEGERERSCAHCGTWVRRIDRTGDVERDFAKDLMQQYSKQYGFELASLPAEGTPGLQVTPENRRSLQLAGLARMAAAHGAIVPAKRWLGLVKATFPGVRGAELEGVLDEVRAVVRAEGGSEVALRTIDDAARG